MNQRNMLTNIKSNHGILFEIMLLLGFIGVGTMGRYILYGLGMQPFPNFEIIMVATFLAAIFLRPVVAFMVPLFSMILSDILIGNPIFVGSEMNRIVLFTYSGFALVAVISIFKRSWFRNGLGEMRLKNIAIAAGTGIGFVLLYDVWTNIGWWYLIYPHSAGSLAAVFAAGVPFMLYHLISGVFTFLVIALPIISYMSSEQKLELPRIKLTHKLPIVAVAVALIVLSLSGTAMQVSEKSDIWLENSDETSVKVVISGDSWEIADNIFAHEEDTVLSLLEKCSERNDFTYESTYYEEFNAFIIESIDGLSGNWYFLINGEIIWEPADKVYVENGDIIVWTFQ